MDVDCDFVQNVITIKYVAKRGLSHVRQPSYQVAK